MVLSLRQELEVIGENSKIAGRKLSKLGTREKNEILSSIKVSMRDNSKKILDANKLDMENGRKINLSEGLLDRLYLNDDRIESMVLSIDTIIELEDPIGEIENMKTLENGLMLGKKSVPIGVIAIIYEARPNVTLDASILGLKSSNTIILRGGKEAFNSNKAIADAIREGIKNSGNDENMVTLIEDTSRESSTELMKLKGYIDLLIPRGSASLINTVVENAKVPTLETGVGNCHIYVDKSAKIDMALNIIENAKTTRVGVCNAMESLLVHESVSDEFYSGLKTIIDKYSLTVYGDERSRKKIENLKVATEEEYAREYLDYAMSMKIVDGIEEAIDHIYKYSTGHSDVIITEDYNNAMKFLNEVDSACVYVNASSRYTDGAEFGKGAEMGISTQKLHARGPIGLRELTSTKYVILGSGQIRK
ncbi:glutamate-5-semialdehyde dehydrogenase [Anaerosphaera aminiphila DSM 21120]|uniref:Gamma-glutamyl phosphate reductase n=1 Tax=Anaerosphaera aminiphila DSM 21120 TaxID=1120995 RepID=A0A1M5RLX3_9FIRM|nr:glutamate-5-semialdehyde dehydrogenase [Anaerosphaera aminiphila]SHH27211.1 glutamate-5-semialdehyde dehydrogenase [Anaerosphaera aminiphila DSM 21120]